MIRPDDRSPVAVIGGGLMGAGIAQVFAAAGREVRVHEPSDAVRATIRARVEAGLEQLGMDPSLAAQVSTTQELADAVAGCGFITEAAPEKLGIKRTIFSKLEVLAPADAILASNTSVIPIGSIIAGLATQHRMVGTHWWNPAPLVPLVEVIQAASTSDETIDATMALLSAAGKKPAHIRKDIPGFVANRLQHALWREAIAMVADGVCDARTLDDCVKNSFGLRLAVLGPLENADLVGLDLTRDIHRSVVPALNCDPAPNIILDRLIDEGRLGFKSGEGFQVWSEERQVALRRALVAHLVTARASAAT